MKTFKLLVLAIALHVTNHMQATPINIDSLEKTKQDQPFDLKSCQATLQVGISAGDDASLSYEASFSWFPLRYAGLGMAIELDDNKGNQPLFASSKYDDYTYDHTRVMRLNLQASMAFRAPLIRFRKMDGMLMLQCNPGLVISVPKNDSEWLFPPYSHDANGRSTGQEMHLKNRDGQILAWRVRTALTLYGDKCGVSLGWSISNYNIQSCRNNMYYGSERITGYDHLSNTNTLFVALSYCF